MTAYRARQKNGSQVARILFLLLPTTTAWPCLKNSRNLGTILLPGPVHLSPNHSVNIDEHFIFFFLSLNPANTLMQCKRDCSSQGRTRTATEKIDVGQINERWPVGIGMEKRGRLCAERSRQGRLRSWLGYLVKLPRHSKLRRR